MENSVYISGQSKYFGFLEPDSHGHCVFEIALREANKATDDWDTCAYVARLLAIVIPDR